MGMLAAAGPAAAQDRPVSFSIGGGLALPVGGVTESLGAGGQVSLGLTFPVAEGVGVMAEYNFSSLGGKTLTVPQPLTTRTAEFTGSGWMQFFGGAVRWTPWTSGKTSAYVIGGMGAYHRVIEVSTREPGLVTVCDPSWFICFPSAVSVDQVIGSRSTNDVGVSFGGGMAYRVSDLASIFFEARYHYVWGPDVQTQDGSTINANAQVFPFTVGVRF
jgi:opacity protein-like surface antigen